MEQFASSYLQTNGVWRGIFVPLVRFAGDCFPQTTLIRILRMKSTCPNL